MFSSYGYLFSIIFYLFEFFIKKKVFEILLRILENRGREEIRGLDLEKTKRPNQYFIYNSYKIYESSKMYISIKHKFQKLKLVESILQKQTRKKEMKWKGPIESSESHSRTRNWLILILNTNYIRFYVGQVCFDYRQFCFIRNIR